MSKSLPTVFIVLVGGAMSAFAQPSVTAAERSAIASVWNEIGAAVQAKDRAALEKIYTEDFLHVHAIGKIDDRKIRLDVLLSGEPTIDTAAAVEVGFRKYGDLIVAVGKISMIDKDSKSTLYSVTRVYVKQNGRWRFASSHASLIAPK